MIHTDKLNVVDDNGKPHPVLVRNTVAPGIPPTPYVYDASKDGLQTVHCFAGTQEYRCQLLEQVFRDLTIDNIKDIHLDTHPDGTSFTITVMYG